MVFALASDMTDAYDISVLGQLLTDTDTPVAANQIQFSPYTISAIARASADIRMACQVATRYTDADLALIYASTDASLRMQIVSLCVDRAFGYIINRRAQKAADYKELSIRAQMTDQVLEFLRQGGRLFTLPDQELAGVQVDVVMVAQSPLNSIVFAQPRYWPLSGLVANRGFYGQISNPPG